MMCNSTPAQRLFKFIMDQTGIKNTVANGGKFKRMDCERPWLGLDVTVNAAPALPTLLPP